MIASIKSGNNNSSVLWPRKYVKRFSLNSIITS